MTRTVAAIVSGGLDSVTLAYHLAAEAVDEQLVMVSVDYGQRHRVELRYAGLAAADLGVEHVLVDLTSITSLVATSALTGAVDVPEGHYAEDSMRATVVPNRNAILLAVATGLVVARGGGLVATAVHAGDHFVYPDCRPGFISAMSEAMRLGSDGMADVAIAAPFVQSTKADIVRRGAELGVPFVNTWSCYQGGTVHCGVCGTCTERREAFELAGVDDPTEYADLTRHW